MNKTRRQRLLKILDVLRDLQEEEQEAYENMPEGLQESERGQQILENSETMQSSHEELEAIALNEPI